MIAQELGKHLDILKSNGYPIQKVFGHSYIEVKPMELKKVTNFFNIIYILSMYVDITIRKNSEIKNSKD